MGHEDEGDAGLVLQLLQLDLHFLAQLVVERRQRLVEEQHLRLRRQRPRQRDALLLTAGNLARLPLGEFLHPHQLQHVPGAGIDLGAGLSEHFEAEADVLRHGHVREQRVALEHSVDRPLEGRQQSDVLTVEQDLAVGRKFEAGDQAQQRCLAAARGTEKREELVFANADGHGVQCRHPCFACSKDLSDAANLDSIPARFFRHAHAPLNVSRSSGSSFPP